MVSDLHDGYGYEPAMKGAGSNEQAWEYRGSMYLQMARIWM